MASKWSVAFEDLGASKGRVAAPPGYDPSSTYEEAPKDQTGAVSPVMVKKMQEALWARANAPMKQVGMMCFMQWMMGNQAHLMTILMVAGIVYNHISQILTANNMFRGSPELDTFGPKMAFIGVQAAGLAFAMWKLNGMGLLPTYASDWYDGSVPDVVEFSAGSVLPRLP